MDFDPLTSFRIVSDNEHTFPYTSTVAKAATVISGRLHLAGELAPGLRFIAGTYIKPGIPAIVRQCSRVACRRLQGNLWQRFIRSWNSTPGITSKGFAG